MGSIVSQGRVEAILASKPEERRTLVEEAAGLGRFKRRRHRAELKLARVATQVERARDVEAEVAKRLRPLALQATAAERAEKLGVEIAGLRAGIAALDLACRSVRRSRRPRGRRDAFARQKQAAEEALEALLAERGRAEEALAEAAGGREGTASTLYRLRSASRAARAPPGGGRVAARPACARRRRPSTPGCSSGRASPRRGRAVLERAIAEREGLPPAARALAEEGASLALSLAEVEEGRERAVAAAVGAALVASTPEEGLRLLEQARERGLGNLTVLVRPGAFEPLDGIDVVPARALLAATGPAVTRRGPLLRPDARRAHVHGRHGRGGAARAGGAAPAAARRGGGAAGPEAARAVPRLADPALVAAGAALVESISAALRAVERLQAPMLGRGRPRRRPRRRARRRAARARRARGRAPPRALRGGRAGGGVDVEVARFEAERGEAQRRLDAAGAEPAEGAPRGARREARAARAPPRAARRRQPVREGGVRSGEGAARRAAHAARGPRALAGRAARTCATS